MENSINIMSSIVDHKPGDNNDMKYNSVLNKEFKSPSAPPMSSGVEMHPIVVSPEHTFSPIESLPMIDHSTDINVYHHHSNTKEDSVYHHPNPKKDIKNPYVITLIVLACIIVILICIFIPLIVLGKQNATSDSGGTSGGNKGHHKFLALRHRRKKPKNKFEHGKNHDNKSSGNDPSGWQLYTLEGCGYCTKQMEALKGFNTFVKYARGKPDPIINNISGELYPREKMSGFPLWYNSNTKEVKMGFQQDICNLNPKISIANC
jgi:hypothetical protein